MLTCCLELANHSSLSVHLYNHGNLDPSLQETTKCAFTAGCKIFIRCMEVDDAEIGWKGAQEEFSSENYCSELCSGTSAKAQHPIQHSIVTGGGSTFSRRLWTTLVAGQISCSEGLEETLAPTQETQETSMDAAVNRRLITHRERKSNTINMWTLLWRD